MKLTPKDKVQYAKDRVRDEMQVAIPTVLAKWEVIEDDSPATPTARANSKKMWYNPHFIESLTLAETCVLILHEASHPLLNHPLRFKMWLKRLGVDPKSALAKQMHAAHNVAADLAINSMHLPIYIKWGGQSMIPKGCFPRHGKYAGLPEGKSLDYYLRCLWDEAKMKPVDPNDPKGPEPQEGEDEGDDGEPGDEEGEGGEGEGNGGDGDGDGGDEGEGDSGSGDAEGKGRGKGKGKGGGSDPGDGDGGGGGDTGGDPGDSGDGASGGGSDSNSAIQDGKDGDAEGDAAGGKEPKKTAEQESMENNVFGHYDADEDEKKEDGTDTTMEDLENEEREWRRAVASAIVMFKDCGTGAGDAITSSLINEALIEQPDDSVWITEAQRFLTRYAPGGYTFNRLSRRNSHRQDIIFPDSRARNAGNGLVLVDTSGSMGDAECDRGLLEIERFLVQYPNSEIQLITCDDALVIGNRYTPSDFPITDFEGWKGRGGTNLKPAFDYAMEHRSEYDWLICITDMDWNYNAVEDPGIPTFWLHVDPWGNHYLQHGEPNFGIYCAMAPTNHAES